MPFPKVIISSIDGPKTLKPAAICFLPFCKKSFLFNLSLWSTSYIEKIDPTETFDSTFDDPSRGSKKTKSCFLDLSLSKIISSSTSSDTTPITDSVFFNSSIKISIRIYI